MATVNLGERNGNAKVSKQDVIKIRERLSHGELCKDLALEYGLSPSAVSLIKAGINWRQSIANGEGGNPPARIDKNPTAKLSDVQIPQIRRLLAEGLKCDDIGREFGVSGAAIRLIRKNRTWSHVA